MRKCPVCAKNLEAHATVGPEKDFKVGDVSICIGCATPLILVALPYEFRIMTPDELLALDTGTSQLLRRARKDILDEITYSRPPS